MKLGDAPRALLLFLLTACAGDEKTPPASTDNDPEEEPTICDCNELALDEGYNHFYFKDRTRGFNGDCFSIYPNGQHRVEKHFVDGKVDGQMRTFYENGQVKTEQTFEMNLQTGLKINYSKEGDTTYHAIYERGKLVEILINESGYFE